ncbi:adenylyl cyclase X E-like isoform X2 [Zeugodacus cucurbitae]|uniref:adenylyl cyclase X E-like isoform X2 n=1 Tax=Zeugodacus cucurbitae TaxID=28588 RepID=UPI0023D93840|nr:adenylyl cyclase X E-like isoform X2 [Zeugodacus cucurbitae]
MYASYDRNRKFSVNVGDILDDVTNQFKGKYELSVLREHCRKYDVEKIYQTYMARLLRIQLITFLTIVIIITAIYCVLLIDSDMAMLDIPIYVIFSILAIVAIYIGIWKRAIAKFAWVIYVAVLSIIFIMIMDITVPVVHAVSFYEITIPLFYSFIIYSIYIYMPFTNHLYPFILGVSISLCYIILFLSITYRMKVDGSTNMDEEKIISEILFMVGLNLLGLFFRLPREMVVRQTFIDKRECVEEDLLLHAAKTQEKILLLSMIPGPIADKIEEDIKLRLTRTSLTSRRRSSFQREAELLYRKLFIETHDDVTILYADMVNYTKLTTTVDVKTLVETLHDLYVRFDDAALDLDVLRIQFLGDCYYCVANVSIPNEDHGNACVRLGLRMIEEIHAERDNRDLEMDIRIGVHSGSVLSGVIGATKWKFDIYSKDVEIANRLESTGVPGRVHISGETLELLDNEFEYEDGTTKALNDPLLQQHSIRTYLIIPPKAYKGKQTVSNPTLMSKFSFLKGSPLGSASDLRTVYSGDIIQRMVDMEMRRESTSIPVETLQFHRIFFGKSRHLTRFEREEHNFRVNFSWWFMCFKNWRWEHNYLIQPDIKLKYSVLVSYIIILCTIFMQAINARQSIKFWLLVAVGNVVMLLVLGLVWYKKLREVFQKNWFFIKPRNKYSRFIYGLSEFTQREFSVRICIYLGILILQLSYTLIQLLDCDRFRIENEEIENLLFEDGTKDILCFNTWAVTECIVMNLFLNFLFSGITYIIKIAIGLLTLISYIIVITVLYDFVYERSLSCNSHLYPEYSHIFVSILTLIIFNMINRQKEFISRVDYYWKRELKKKQENARLTNETISRLVSNILPSHIVDIYMDNQLTNKLYYEEYSNVAVIFATILNFNIEVVGMRVLNEIICDFDEVLGTFKGVHKIEKIKVAGWTYMAACGLNTTGTGHRGSLEQRSSAVSFAFNWRRDQLANRQAAISELYVADVADVEEKSTTNVPRRRSVRMFNDGEEPITDDDVVYVMARFGLSLLRTMDNFNKNNYYHDNDSQVIGDLRVGIANGPVMAGVVGLFKPHYDIWGNSVNMAARMDSTGVANSIQVTEETAKILTLHDIHCIYRGVTYIKGRGSIPTYFLDIDENFQFRKFSLDGTELDP